jgi:cobalt-zinc-cadmium resistance protein CzcA
MLAQVGACLSSSATLATIGVSNQPRLGIAGKDNDDDIVRGIVLMRRGEKSMPTIKRVQRGVSGSIPAISCLPASASSALNQGILIDIDVDRVHNMVIGIADLFAAMGFSRKFAQRVIVEG